jgi:hypothetical protein
MSSVRIPLTAESLLPFCRPFSGRRENACFSTYADLVIFAAGYGYSHLQGTVAPACRDFIEGRQPHPIDYGVFRNSSYPILLLLCIATTKNTAAVRDDDEVIRVLENFAAVGFGALAQKLAQSNPDEFHVELAQLVLESAARPPS